MGPDSRGVELGPGNGETSLVLTKPVEAILGYALAKSMMPFTLYMRTRLAGIDSQLRPRHHSVT
jgi:hypothetical protein